MINYKGLPKDGVLFEQLIRELFISINCETFWTGVGPDGGRDLIVTEELSGLLSKYQRRWLVSCKHFAHADRSVGVDDIINIKDCMEAINATGFILACSTYPSASLIKRLDELFNPKNIPYIILDGISIEKRILSVNSMHLLFTFFPDDTRTKLWNVFPTLENGVWSAYYCNHFFFYTSRDRIVSPPLEPIEYIIDVYDLLFIKIMKSIKEITKNPDFNIIFRYRGFYWDDKHCDCLVYIDCQLEKPQKPELEDYIKNFFSTTESVISDEHRYANIANIDLKFIYPSFFSDHYHEDHYHDYNPFYDKIKKGKERDYNNFVW